MAASEVQHRYDLDEVIFVPTATQPFKKGRRVTVPEHRYLMTSIATASNPRFTVSRVDIERGETTYTVDTLRDLKRERPGCDLFFITGADALRKIMDWKNADELFQLARFVGVTRPGHRWGDTEKLPAERVSLLEVPAMAISSTDIRQRVASGAPIWYLTPDGVVQYIAKYGLYLEDNH